jgi:magnesium-transporting ATPase (P-type)
MKDSSQPSFLPLAAKTIVCHTITYFIMGVLAAHFLNYAELMARPDSGMKPITDPWVMAGPLFQPLRGLVFALVFYPFRERLFGTKNGWLLMAWMLIGLGILSTFGPASGSIEGMIYTPTPIRFQLRGWLEIVPQALLLSALLCYWVNHADKKWLNWLLGVVFFLMMALPVLGLLTRKAG